MARLSRYAVLLSASLLSSGEAYALGSDVAAAKNQPVMLTADAMGYEEPTATAIAVGHVEVVQGDTILLADRVTYNQNTDTVHAVGHVSMLQSSGDVLFADDAELKQSMEKGVVQEFRARLKDNSLFAAREANKLSKNVTQMHEAVYSPCNVCAAEAEQKQQKPLWQMEAKTVTIDEDAQRVSYQNAFMDVYGMPVLYTPYFSHPTPDAPSQSGLLMPTYYHNSNIGNVVKQPMYVSIAPNMDMTITPWYISGENSPMLQGEFRALTQDSTLTVQGAVIDAYNRDAAGNIISGTEVRDYIDAHGTMKLSEHWTSGVDLEHASDDTFLALYGFTWQDMLTSRLYAERIDDRDYAVVQSLAFQGLQPQDIANQSPYILPQAIVHVESDPLDNHSRFALDSSALVLERQVGDSDQRVSSTASWKLPYITPGGQVYEVQASIRGDAYNVINQTVSSTTGETFSGDTGRVIPEVDFNWRYPFVDRIASGTSLTVSPVIELAASPNMHETTNIPNEDSQISELSDINLFSADRFTGLDEVESGFRGTIGTRGQLQFGDEKYFEWLFGQAYQENVQSPFPIAVSDPSANFSDYVGRLALRYKWLDTSYSFRLDRYTFDPITNEVWTTFNLKPVSISASFIDLRDDPLFGTGKEIFGNVALDLTRNWTWNVSGRRDLGSSETTSVATTDNAQQLNILNPLNPSAGTVGLGTSLVFHNECVQVTGMVARNEISEQDIRPSTTISVTVTLQNFGGPDTTHASANTQNTAPGTEKINYDDTNGVSNSNNVNNTTMAGQDTAAGSNGTQPH